VFPSKVKHSFQVRPWPQTKRRKCVGLATVDADLEGASMPGPGIGGVVNFDPQSPELSGDRDVSRPWLIFYTMSAEAVHFQ
jgi:hypothetical protein